MNSLEFITNGVRRIFLDLREAGETCSLHRVERIMRLNKIVGWTTWPTIHRGLVLDAVMMAVKRRRPKGTMNAFTIPTVATATSEASVRMTSKPHPRGVGISLQKSLGTPVSARLSLPRGDAE